jgi:hypothetical protein
MAAPRKSDSNRFIDWVIPENLLEDSIRWINSNLNPEDVFSMEDLNTWALDHGYSKTE